MYYIFIAVIALNILANTFSVTCDLVRYKPILEAMDKAGVPRSWLPYLGILKALGVIGLLIGFKIPHLGIAASIGLVLFYIGAIITHLRIRDYNIGLPSFFLLMAAASLALELIIT